MIIWLKICWNFSAPRPAAKAEQHRVARCLLFRLQAHEPLAGQVQIGLFFYLPVRQIIQKLQKDHLH